MISLNRTPFRKLIWYKRVIGEITPSVEKTVSGAVVHVLDALTKPFVRLTASITTAEGESGFTECNVTRTGKNILPPTIYNLAQGSNIIQADANYRGMYCRIPSAGKYTISRDIVSGNRFRLFATVDEPAENVTAYTLVNSSATDAELSLTVDFPSGYNYLFIYLANDGSTITSNVMVEAGETASTYEAYLGETVSYIWGASFDNVTWTIGSYIAENGSIGTNTNLRYSSLIPVTYGNWVYKYTHVAKDINTRIHGYDSSGNWVEQLLVIADKKTELGDKTAEIIVPDDVAYLCISTGNSSNDTPISLSMLSDSNGIIHSGTLNVTSGVLTVNDGDEPQTYQLTPYRITALLGENYVWADTGDSELTYLAEA